MSWAFITILALYAMRSAIKSRLMKSETPAPGRRLDILTLILQTPLFIIAFILFWKAGLLDRDLISPAAMILGIAAGHLIFFGSLLITHQVFHDAWQLLIDGKGIRAFLADNPMLVLQFLTVAIAEELIYRVAAQDLVLLPLVGSPVIAIMLTAVFFSFAHEHFLRNTLIGSAEFFGFALILGLLYHSTQSIPLVVLIHVIRNLESVYLEYVALLDETGDLETARQRLESLHVRRPKSAV